MAREKDVAKFLVGKRSKVFNKINPADMKTKMQGTWYLRTFIEKFFFLFGAIATVCLIIWDIGKIGQVIGR